MIGGIALETAFMAIIPPSCHARTPSLEAIRIISKGLRMGRAGTTKLRRFPSGAKYTNSAAGSGARRTDGSKPIKLRRS